MRILHLVQGYSPAIGGTEFLIQNISERMVSLFHDEVDVFTTTSFNTEGFVHRDAPQMKPGIETINGVTVRRFPVFNAAAPFLRYIQYLAFRLRLPRNDLIRTLYVGPIVKGMTKSIIKNRPDVVAASSFPLRHMQYAVKAGKKGIPVVLIGGLHPQDAWGFDRRDIYTAIRKADRYIAYTTFERDYVVGRGISPDKIRVIGAGVNISDYKDGDGSAFRARHNLSNDPLVAFIGQQGGHKGIDCLIHAMRLVWRHIPKARLVIAGATTKYSPVIDAMIEKLSERERARVLKLDGVSHEEKCDILHACDVFASPSGFESFGITFLEAWAAGKPVIGTRSGAIPTVIDENKDGLLCDYGNSGELAGAIVELLGDAAARTRLARAGMAKVKSEYTWDIVTTRLREVYQELAEGNSY